MKIIFSNEKEKEKFIRRVAANMDGCPDDVGLTNGDNAWCPGLVCVRCWKEALESVSEVRLLKKFFYTFGSDKEYPFGR